MFRIAISQLFAQYIFQIASTQLKYLFVSFFVVFSKIAITLTFTTEMFFFCTTFDFNVKKIEKQKGKKVIWKKKKNLSTIEVNLIAVERNPTKIADDLSHNTEFILLRNRNVFPSKLPSISNFSAAQQKKWYYVQ